MKKNGFVFMETIVVISVLSLTLVLLFASFSFILRKSRERNNYDTIEMLYKTNYIKQLMREYKPADNDDNPITYYVNNASECHKMGEYESYVCDLSSDDYNGYLLQTKLSFEVQKIYYVNPTNIEKSNDKINWLNLFDATTIDYLISLGVNGKTGINEDIMIVKYKKVYEDGSYETYHSMTDSKYITNAPNYVDDDEICDLIKIGSESFCVFSNDGTTVKALALYNLEVGNSDNSYYPADIETNIQTPRAGGNERGSLLGNQLNYATISFAKERYWGNISTPSVLSLDDEKNIFYPYIQKYKKILENYGSNIQDVTLMKVEDFLDVGCEVSSYWYSCTNAPAWLANASFSTRTIYDTYNLVYYRAETNRLTYENFDWNNFTGIRPVIVISHSEYERIKELNRIEDIPRGIVLTNDLNKNEKADIGDVISIGYEKFYVISNNGTTIKALAGYNLEVGNEGNSSNPVDYETIIQTPESSSPIISGTYAKIKFANSEYWSNTGDVNLNHSDNIINDYLIHYSGVLKTLGAKIKDISLISTQELNDLGCNMSTCSSAPSWVNKTDYWTKTSVSHDGHLGLYIVKTNGSINKSNFDEMGSYGIRPVISFDISDLKLSD